MQRYCFWLHYMPKPQQIFQEKACFVNIFCSIFHFFPQVEVTWPVRVYKPKCIFMKAVFTPESRVYLQYSLGKWRSGNIYRDVIKREAHRHWCSVPSHWKSSLFYLTSPHPILNSWNFISYLPPPLTCLCIFKDWEIWLKNKTKHPNAGIYRRLKFMLNTNAILK